MSIEIKPDRPKNLLCFMFYSTLENFIIDNIEFIMQY